MRDGWIPAHRKLYDPSHPLAPSKRDPACRRDAWLDLCQMAQHTPREQRGERLERGEVLVAVRTKAEHWGWSKSRVSRFLLWLASESMIGTVRGTPIGTVYRIVNYDTYAVLWDGERDTDRDSERDASGTRAGQEQPLTSKQEPPLSPPRRSPKRPLPDRWQPTDQHRERAQAEGVDADREAEAFRNHALANDRRQVDWDRAFTTWLLRAKDFKRNGTPSPRSQPIARPAKGGGLYVGG